jgi:hypothetical protein
LNNVPRQVFVVTAVLVAIVVAAPWSEAQGSDQGLPTPRTEGALAITRSESLEGRVAAYWARKQAKDLAGMYEFYSAEYRARVSREEFLKLTRLIRFDVLDVKVAASDEAAARREVKISFRTLVPGLATPMVNSTAIETWVLEHDGRWSKLEEPVPFPPGMAGRSK